MGAVAYSSSSGSFNVPSVVQQVWVSCVGGGGGANNNRGGGGGGWSTGARSVTGTTINFTAGVGGSPFNNGGTSSCLGVAVGGGGAGASTVSAPGFIGGASGAPAAGVSGFGATDTDDPLCVDTELGQPVSGYAEAHGGGNGNNGFGGTVGGGNGIAFGNCDGPVIEIGGNGGAYGGGGGVPGGSGGAGFVYVSWIDITAGATTLRSGQSTTVSWDSPVDSGSQTVSYTNNGTTNITQTFTRTDSRGAQSTITFTILPAVRINSFSANPNPQTSGSDGIPNYNTTLNWGTTGATSASINQGIGTVAGNGSTTVTNLPQSVAGSNSPATRTYTLTASDGFNTVTETLTVSVFNDNTPNNYSIPNQSNLEPNTSYNINLDAITGIDMVTNVIGGPGVTVTKNNLQNYVSSINIVNGDSVQLRFFSDSFNTDPNGQPTAPRSLYIDIGPVRRFFTISTRAPDVNETFNMKDENTRVPFPDIDTISEPSLEYIVSETLSVDDIELQSPNGVEIKISNANTQVRINGGTWQDVRSI